MTIPDKLIRVYAEACGWSEAEGGPTDQDFVMAAITRCAKQHLAEAAGRAKVAEAMADPELLDKFVIDVKAKK